MSEIVQITDYDVNQDILLQQYKEKAKFIQVLHADSLQNNDIEAALFEIRDLFFIDTAEGVQLDIIGAIHGESRQSRNDTDYRTGIKTKFNINLSSGTPEEIITAVKYILGLSSGVQVQNAGDAKLNLTVPVTITYDQYILFKRLISAGVGLYAFMYPVGDTPFVFLDDPDGAGFGKCSDDDIPGTFSDGTAITFSDGDPLTFLVNEPDPDDGGTLSGVWQEYP